MSGSPAPGPGSPGGGGEAPDAPTEALNEAARGLDTRDARGILEVIHREDHRAWEAVGEVLGRLAPVVDRVVEAFRAGGRLVYCGAGTSGRLGALDAAECPPTFGVPPELVVGLVAGGEAALRQAVEGAEDSPEDGAAAVRGARVGARDVVCGIATSGTTPWVLGALAEARARGAYTVLVHCNPALEEDPPAVDRTVPLDTGPEVVAGSTRLKGGTATKLVLHGITTAAMVRWGRVHDNLMVDLVPTNRKLRRRARELVRRLGAVDLERAGGLLDATGGRVKEAVLMARAGVGPEAARRLLERHEGCLRDALRSAGAGPAPDASFPDFDAGRGS